MFQGNQLHLLVYRHRNRWIQLQWTQFFLDINQSLYEGLENTFLIYLLKKVIDYMDNMDTYSYKRGYEYISLFSLSSLMV